MNCLLALAFAATLSVGNAEFEAASRTGAVQVAVARLTRETLAAPPVAAGTLKAAMLADPAKFATRAQAEAACRETYRRRVAEAYRAEVRKIVERMGVDIGAGELGADAMERLVATHFPPVYARERDAACAEQAKGIAGAVRPSEAEFEAKDEATLRREMTAKVAARQKGGVFEENLGFISETIVDPVIADGRREMRRQREYLKRTRCEAYAPSLLGRELEANLRRNVERRNAKTDDPVKAWGVFPGVLKEGIPAAVERRTLERVVREVDDVPVAVAAETVLKTIASDPAKHRRAADSEKAFRGLYAGTLTAGVLARAGEAAPEAERAEFAAYVRAQAAAPELVRAVETRIRREVMPKWKAIRAEVARSEAKRIWPTLTDRTWYPDAELADVLAARSDYAAAVRNWRSEPGLATLARADGGRPLLEETAADADRAVAAAFDLARSAIAAQNAIVGEVGPSVLAEARSRKASVLKATPDLKSVVGMLTAAVEEKWGERRVETLWGKGSRPANADVQHAALFPSVRRRIELVARSILEDMQRPEVKPDEKPEPQEAPKSDAGSSDEPPPLKYTIVVERAGDRVVVRLEQGGTAVIERKAKAKMGDYRNAVKAVSDKLGVDVLRLK